VEWLIEDLTSKFRLQVQKKPELSEPRQVASQLSFRFDSGQLGKASITMALRNEFSKQLRSNLIASLELSI